MPDTGARRQVPLAILALTCSPWLASCGDAEPDPSSRPAEIQSAETEAEIAARKRREDEARLRELGYANYAEAAADEDEAFVTMPDPDRVAPGHNLIPSAGELLLFDSRANLLHRWSTPGVSWTAPLLLPNGDVLVSGAADGSETRPGLCIARLAWDGEPVWWRWTRSHHDVDLSADGTVATLTAMKPRVIPSIHPEYKVRDEGVATLSLKSGRVLQEISLHDLMVAAPEHVEIQLHPRAQTAMEREGIDLFHSNAVDFLRDPSLEERDPIYTVGHVLITIRHQDTVMIVDLEEERVVWAWGQGEIQAPHDGHVLPNGNVLIFDNGPERGWSRVVEVDPLTREIVWQWSADEPTDFFTIGRGSVQRFENGNTLLADSDSGEALEVTREGEVVWHFRNFDKDDEGRRATFAFIRRHPTELVDALLAAGK